MDNPALDNIISEALHNLEQLGMRLNTGHDGVCLLVTRDIIEYATQYDLYLDHLEFSENITLVGPNQSCRFHRYDVYFVTSDDDERLGVGQHFICPAIKRERVNLAELQDGDTVIWDDEVFRSESGNLRGLQAMVTHNYLDAPATFETPTRARRGMRANALLFDEAYGAFENVVAERIHAALDEFAPVEAIAANDTPYTVTFRNGNGITIRHADAAEAIVANDTNVTEDLGTLHERAGWIHDNAATVAAAQAVWDEDPTHRYVRDAYAYNLMNNATTTVTPTNITGGTITGGYVDTTVTAPTIDWDRVATLTTVREPFGNTDLGRWEIRFDEVEPFFGEDICEAKPKKKVKEPELKRSKALDDFIDQFAPKK